MTEQLPKGFTSDSPNQFVSNKDMAEYERERQRLQEEAEAKGGLWDLAMENQFLTDAIFRRQLRQEIRQMHQPAEFDFEVTQQMLDQFGTEFNYKEQEFLRGADSESELQARIGWVREDIKRHQDIAAFGTKGVIAEVAAGIADPAGWAIGLASGGVGFGAKLGMIGRAVRGGLITGAESALIESALVYSDTQRDADDILMAMGTGALIGGTLGAVFRGNHPDMANVADTADNALTQSAESIADVTISKVKDKANPKIETTDLAAITDNRIPLTEVEDVTHTRLDTQVIDNSIAQRRQQLEADAIIPDLKGRKKATVKAQIRDIKNSIAENTKKWREDYAAVAAKNGAPTREWQELIHRWRLDAVNAKYEPVISKMEKQVEVLEDKLTRVKEAKQRKSALDEFNAMSRSEQIRALFPEGAPMITKMLQREVAAIKEVVPKPRVEQVAKETLDSAGAARVKGSIIDEDLFTTGETMDEWMATLAQEISAVPKSVTKILPKKLRAVSDRAMSLFTTMDNSTNSVFRALTHRLFENPQGNVLPQDTAAILSYVYTNQIKGAVRNRYQEGFEAWSKKQGRGVIRSMMDFNRQRTEFDKMVYSEIVNPKTTDPHIKDAADGLRDGFQKALELRKANGEAGFEKVSEDSRYVPRIFSGINMNRVAAQPDGRNKVIGALTRGYMEGGKELTEKAARKLAEIQYVRAMDSTLSANKAYKNVVSKADRERFIEDLRQAGVDESFLKELVEGIESKGLLEGVSSRAKTGFFINPDSTYQGVKVMDLLETDLSKLSEAYFRESAGGAAMARHGFKTIGQAMDVIDAGEAYARNLGMDAKRMAEEADMLRDGIKLIYGQSIEENPTGKIEIGTRRLRDYTANIRLGQVGFAQFAEASRAIAHLGLLDTLRHVPATAIFRRRGARIGEKSSGLLKEPELREIEEYMGYIGEDSWLSPPHLRQDDWGDAVEGSDFGRLWDNAMAVGARANVVLSGFQAIQGGLEKIVMRAVKRKLIDNVLNGKANLDKKLMQEVGWTDEYFAELKNFLEANPKYDEYKGKQIRLMNFDKMPPALRERTIIGMTRMKGRMIQRNFVGETSTWMNKWLGKTLTQFRTFSLVSAEKQLIHDLRGNHIKAAQILGWSSLLGYISYATQAHLQALGQDDPEKFLDERMSEQNLAFGVFNKMPQTAVLSLGGDFMATLGLMPEEMYSTGNRFGFRPMTGGTVAPSAGTVGSAVTTFNKFVDLFTGDAEGKDVAESVRRLIPLANTIGVGQLLQKTINAAGD